MFLASSGFTTDNFGGTKVFRIDRFIKKIDLQELAAHGLCIRIGAVDAAPFDWQCVWTSEVARPETRYSTQGDKATSSPVVESKHG